MPNISTATLSSSVAGTKTEGDSFKTTITRTATTMTTMAVV